jgi:hypothetical protein
MLQHRLTSAANSAFVPSCFLPERATQLQSIVGPTFLSSNRELVTAHQSIVTASFLADSTKGDVAFQTNKWLHRQMQDNQSRLKPGTLLLLAWHRHDPEDCTMRDIFRCFGDFKSRDVRIFPSTHELDHAQEKLGDIRALDQMDGHSDQSLAIIRPNAGLVSAGYSNEHIVVAVTTLYYIQRRLMSRSTYSVFLGGAG